MKASIDSVSLILALKIQELTGLINRYFEAVYVTDAVYSEVTKNKIPWELNKLEKLFETGLFEIKNPKKPLAVNLGKGELSAISLALEQKSVFISEDRKAILFADSIGVKYASVLSLLIKARQNNFLTANQAKDILFKLVENGLYMSSELFASVLKRIEK